jgi:transposase
VLTPFLFPDCPDLAVDAIQIDATGLTFLVTTTAAQVRCPVCGDPTTRRHSGYHRTLADAPCATQAVRVDLHTRRFFCPNPTCPRRVFTERVPALAASFARRTTRLTALLQRVGLALGGDPDARLAQALGCPTSARTLLRLVRTTPDPPRATPQHVGIDDFAFRKGHTYGTILVDLDTGTPLDLLADREVESVAAWLRAHPTITLITRDRAEVYASGATQGAPQATQVLDRWHLLHNLSETVDEILQRLTPILAETLTALAEQPSSAPREALLRPEANLPSPDTTRIVEPKTTPAQQRVVVRQEQARQQRRACYEAVHARHAAGQSVRQIAEDLTISRRTVERFLRASSFPDRRPRSASTTQLDPYHAYLRTRWADGCHNAAQLWRELQERGYKGSYGSVYHWLTVCSGSTRQPHAGRSKPKVRRRDWQKYLNQPPTVLTGEEQTLVEQVCAHRPEVGTVYTLVQQFGRLIREQRRDELDPWLAAVLKSGVEELVRFARGIQTDYAGVAAALEHSFSNGPVEGHVNRLKAIKRQMFGRAKFPLLRKRVLCAT